MTKKFRSIKSMRAKSRGRRKGTINVSKVFTKGGSRLLRGSLKLGKGVTNITPSRSAKMARVPTFTERG